MPTFRDRDRHRTVATVLMVLIAALVSLPSVAHAQSDDRPELSIRPAGQAEAAFFDLQVAAGEERSLDVEIENTGTQAVRARTYAGDAYTIVNGGFGMELFGEPASGATEWLDYGTEVLDLAPGQTVMRSFTVRVPPDARAGEHISGLAVENADVIEGSGRVALDQVVRKAIAVLITLPGPVEAGLEILQAEHLVVADRSVIAVDLSNTGNVRLRPRATLTVTDESGAQVARSTVAMDSFYAGTAARLESPLQNRLAAGRYTVAIDLQDPDRDVQASAPALPFDVAAPAEDRTSGDGGVVRRLPAAVSDLVAKEGRRWPIVALLAGLVVGVGAIALRKRRRPIGAHSAPARRDKD